MALFDPFSLVTATEPAATTQTTTDTTSCQTSLVLSSSPGALLGFDEKYVLGAIAGIMIFIFIEEMF